MCTVFLFYFIFLQILTAVKTLFPHRDQLSLILFFFIEVPAVLKIGVLCATVILRDGTYRSRIWRPAGKQCPRSSVMSLLLRSRVSTETSSLVRLPSILRILLWCLENKKNTLKALGVLENPTHRPTTLPYKVSISFSRKILPCLTLMSFSHHPRKTLQIPRLL